MREWLRLNMPRTSSLTWKSITDEKGKKSRKFVGCDSIQEAQEAEEAREALDRICGLLPAGIPIPDDNATMPVSPLCCGLQT